MQITFLAENLSDLTKQLRAFIGDVPVQVQPAHVTGRPVPSWAPAGAKWVEMPGAPCLTDSSGQTIAVNWVGSMPTPGTLVVNHNDEAEEQGAAMLASIRGS